MPGRGHRGCLRHADPGYGNHYGGEQPSIPPEWGVLAADNPSNTGRANDVMGIPVTFTINAHGGAGATFAGGVTTTP